jgi:Tol biopolymer transport system component
MRAIWWDPDTGGRGREAARWPANREAFHALAPDGHTMARVTFRDGLGFGDVELVDLAAEHIRRLDASGLTLRFLAFQPDGKLVAVGALPDDRHVLVRLDDRGPPQILATDDKWLDEPRISADGKRLALTVSDAPRTLWWVDGAANP